MKSSRKSRPKAARPNEHPVDLLIARAENIDDVANVIEMVSGTFEQAGLKRGWKLADVQRFAALSIRVRLLMNEILGREVITPDAQPVNHIELEARLKRLNSMVEEALRKAV